MRACVSVSVGVSVCVCMCMCVLVLVCVLKIENESKYLLQFFPLLPFLSLRKFGPSFSFERSTERRERIEKLLVILIVKILLPPIKGSSMRLMRPSVRPVTSINSLVAFLCVL